MTKYMLELPGTKSARTFSDLRPGDLFLFDSPNCWIAEGVAMRTSDGYAYISSGKHVYCSGNSTREVTPLPSGTRMILEAE